MITAKYKIYDLLLGSHSYFELVVGVKPSFGFFKMSSLDVKEVLETENGEPGDLILSDGVNTVTLKNMYLIKSVKQQLPQTEGPESVRLCDVIIADERILWYFKNGTQDYNTYKSSREGLIDFVLSNLNKDNEDKPWTFEEIIEELKTLTGASDMILNTSDFTDYPVREPRHIVGCNIPVNKLIQQVLENLNAFLTLDYNASGQVTYEFYRLGLTEQITDTIQLETYALYLKEKCTIEVNPKVQSGATLKMVAAADAALNEDLRSCLYGSETIINGSGTELIPSIYAVLGDEVNSVELETISSEILQEHAESFSNVWRNEIYAGLLPFKLNRAVHSVRWFFTTQGAFTQIKAFRPRPEELKLADDLFHYSRFPVGADGGSTKTYARIIQSLQRKDEVLGYTARNWYEVELLSLSLPTYTEAAGTYKEGELYKYSVSGVMKLFRVKEGMTFTQPPIILPTNTTYWEEASWHRAWVFGYTYDLLASDYWFPPGEIVEIIRYEDSRPEFVDREWWIIGTVSRIEIDGPEEDGVLTVIGSLAFNAIDWRTMGVFT